MALSICCSLFSAANIRVRADMELDGFQDNGIAFGIVSVFGSIAPSAIGKRFGTGTVTKDVTLFAASAAAAEKRLDSFPTINIPRVISRVYSEDGLWVKPQNTEGSLLVWLVIFVYSLLIQIWEQIFT